MSLRASKLQKPMIKALCPGTVFVGGGFGWGLGAVHNIYIMLSGDLRTALGPSESDFEDIYFLDGLPSKAPS